MADDGMLLNFEIGDAPLKTQVKFKGGRWRDRLKAQRTAKQAAIQGQQQRGPSSATPQSQHQHHDHDAARPAKRPRTDDGDSQRHAKLQKTADPGPKAPSRALRTGQISSGLFTKNPAAVTDFDKAPVADNTEPAKPSNAPLSDEAESFFSLGLSRRIAQHLTTKLEMKAPTAIQKRTVPQLINDDSDAFLQAETGSGKTLAYLLPIVHRIMALSVNPDGTLKDTKVHRNSGLFAIVLGPTRELCKQIATVLEKLLRCAPWLVCTTVIGGESKKSEKARLRKGVNILVATPGRLADHLDNTKVLDVGTVRWLVLDEGDRMMEMGFEEDIRAIVTKIRAGKLLKENAEGVRLEGVLPSRRVTVLCSATMKMNVQKLGEISLVDAVHITVSKSDVDGEAEAATEAAFAAPSQLKQSYIVTPAKLRLVTLIALLKSTFARRGSVMKAIIFISCADSVDFHYELLKDTKPPQLPTPDSSPSKHGNNAHTEQTVAPAAYVTSPANPKVILHKLHGSLPQPVRSATLNAFARCKDPAVLITTDISSRGLDVPSVDLVIEYDPAFSVADHVHRIGRTARAGRPGKAVLFLLPGCEEGYTSILPAPTPIVPQLYESVLQKGLATAVNLPSTYDSTETEKKTWTTRAESLQLHLEQRLLARPSSDADDDDAEVDGVDDAKEKSKAKSSKGKHAKKKPAPENPLLVSGRQAFRSHIRAYATHVREERVYFDITQLHLGHVAKAFALRETPGGIGGGVGRRTHKAASTTAASSEPATAAKVDGGDAGEKKKKKKKSKGAGKAARDDEDDEDRIGQVDEDAARRMKEKLRMMMNASSEFNIG